MFEDKNWSQALKALVNEIFSRGINSTKEELTTLIDMAVEEGRQEVQEDPGKYSLGNCEDCDERRSDEPQRDESRD